MIVGFFRLLADCRADQMRGIPGLLFLFLLLFSCLHRIAEGSEPAYEVLVAWTDHGSSDNRNQLIEQVVDEAAATINADSYGLDMQVTKQRFACTPQDVAEFLFNLKDGVYGQFKTILAKVCPEHCVAFAHVVSDLKLAPVMFGCNRRMDIDHIYPNVTFLDGATWTRVSRDFAAWNDLDSLSNARGYPEVRMWYMGHHFFWNMPNTMMSHEIPMPSYAWFWWKLIRKFAYQDVHIVMSSDYNIKFSTQATEGLIERPDKNLDGDVGNRTLYLNSIMNHYVSKSHHLVKPGKKIHELSVNNWDADLEKFLMVANMGVQFLIFNLNKIELTTVICRMYKRGSVRADGVYLTHLQADYCVEDILAEAASQGICTRSEMAYVLRRFVFTDAYVTDQAKMRAGSNATWGTTRDLAMMHDGMMTIAQRASNCHDSGCTAVSTTNELTRDEANDLIIGVHDVDFDGWTGNVKFLPTCGLKYARKYSKMYPRDENNHALYKIDISDNAAFTINYTLVALNKWDVFVCPMGMAFNQYAHWRFHPSWQESRRLTMWDNRAVVDWKLPDDVIDTTEWPEFDNTTYARMQHPAWDYPLGEENYSKWYRGELYDISEGEWLWDPLDLAGSNIWHLPPETPSTCTAGSGNNGTHVCVPCQPGTFNDGTFASCQPCSAGSFSNTTRASFCHQCRSGEYVNITGSTACLDCPAGEQSAEASSICDPCTQGNYKRDPGRDEAGGGFCLPCPHGFYSADEGHRHECQACPFGGTTLQVGTLSKDQCLCAPGYYLDCMYDENRKTTSGYWFGLKHCVNDVYFMEETEHRSECKPCPGGFTCAGGLRNYTQYKNFEGDWVSWTMHAQPILEPKYYALPEEPYKAYWCEEAGELCTGGIVDQCGGDRFGLQCANCKYGTTSTKHKPCEPCASGYLVLPSAIIVITVIFFVANAVANSQTAAGTAPAKAIFGSSVTSLLHLFQMLGVVALLEIPWPGLFGDILKYFRFFVLDVGSADTTCYSGQETLPGKYILGVSLSFIMICFFLSLWGASWLLGRTMGTPSIGLDLNKVLNTIGMLFSVFFVGVGKSVFRVLECSDQNPSLKKTLLNYDGHYCSPEALTEVYPVVIFYSLVYLGGMLTIYINVFVKAPTGFYPDAAFRTRYRFLLGRWNPKFYYWGGLWLLKNVGLALVTVLANFEIDEDGRQRSLLALLWMLFFVSPMALLSAYIKPFKEPLANQLDVVFSGAIILLCATGLNVKVYNDERAQVVPMYVRESISEMAVTSFSLGLVASLGVGFYSFWTQIQPTPLTDKLSRTLCELHDLYLEDRKLAESEFKDMLSVLTPVDTTYLHMAMDNIDHVLMCNFDKNGLRGIKPLISEVARNLAPCVDGCLPTQPPAGFAPGKETPNKEKVGNEK